MSRPQNSSSGFKKILATSDGSEPAKRATSTAIDLAKKYHAKLIVLMVIPTPNALSGGGYPMNLEPFQKEAAVIVGDAASLAREEEVAVETKTIEYPGSAVQAIVSYAQDEKVDLIVLGTRGIGGYKKLLLGSVSSGVISHAPCSVLVIR